jgi:CRISPR-associated protein Csx3
MASYKISFEDGNVLKVGFGDPAQNDAIVRDAVARLDEMAKSGELAGGDVIRVNGPASLPVAMVLAHKLAHLYQAVACFDPKLAKYVVAIAHGDKYAIGDLID